MERTMKLDRQLTGERGQKVEDSDRRDVLGDIREIIRDLRRNWYEAERIHPRRYMDRE